MAPKDRKNPKDRNQKKRPQDEEDEPFDPTLVVAKNSDILFKPLEEGGERVLQFVRLKVQQKIRQWTKVYLPTVVEMDSPEDLMYLRSLEPTSYKDQDHYAVLGLGHMRIRANEDDIKRCYRQRVLKHHPDKRMAAGEVVLAECDYFACIVKAFEILSTPTGRASYDSVDPLFDNYVPSKTLSSGDDFFVVYGKWFELNSRWSTSPPVPLLGSIKTPREKVEDFYQYWFNFTSWREYSYLDEEEKEKGSDRDERRWIEKQNKVVRAENKKKEMARIRSAVNNAYDLDPRIQMFKDDDNQKKLEKTLEKQKAASMRQEIEDRARKEAEDKIRIEKEKREAEEKEKEMAAKKEKDSFKKAVKKEKKNFRTICKNNNYFSADDKTIIRNMEDLETLCEILPLNDLEALNAQLASLSLEEGRKVFEERAEAMRLKIQAEKEATAKVGSTTRNGPNTNGNSNGTDDWSSEELALLIKAVNLFPAGTVQRWEVVANFLHQHDAQKRKRTAKEVLAKAKDLKASDFSKNSLKEEANEKAYDAFEKNINAQVRVQAEETKRDDDETVSAKSSKSKITSEAEETMKAWSAEEQKLLEQALRTYPSSHSDRWDMIAGCIPGRSKKECMARFKELAALIKAKKSAQKAS